MIGIALPAIAGALWCWPADAARRRLRALIGRQTGRRWPVPHPGPTVLIGLVALTAWGVAGLGVGVATGVALLTARWRYRASQRSKRQLRTAEAMAGALHGVVLELRAGAHPVSAAEATADDVGPPAADALRAVAATARLGGDVSAVPDQFAVREPALASTLRPIVSTWSLAQRHGLPLADVLDAVHRDLSGRVRFAHKVHARMAGPRASGTVLAVLPLVGVLLGEAMGAHPTRVLLGNQIGQAMLALGVCLAAVGVWWITKLTGRAIPI